MTRLSQLVRALLLITAAWVAVRLPSAPLTTTTDIPAITKVSDKTKRVNNNGSSTTSRLIPRRLIFTFKTDILETKLPSRTYANVLELIESYKTAWSNENDDEDVEIWSLGDSECRTVIQQVEPKLVAAYDWEPLGMFRGDMCRIAALMLKGGYYLDVDLKVVHPLIIVPDNNVAFSTVWAWGATPFAANENHPGPFFQAFMASSPNHVLLNKTLEYMVRYYYHGPATRSMFMGPTTLFLAYDEIKDQLATQSLLFLEEIPLPNEDYSDVPLQKEGGEKEFCNFVVHDPKQKQVHFYSRFVGASRRCTTLNGDFDRE